MIFKGKKILIADDTEINRVVGKIMLETWGCDVEVVENGKEAIEIIEKYSESIDVIIMDLTIPGAMGGKEAVQEILRINPEAKVIVASGYSNDPVMANHQQYGFKASVSKPFRMTELHKVINSVLL